MINPDISKLKTKIFADGADKEGILKMYSEPWISGFTTNPTLMKKSGIQDYEKFAHEILQLIPDKPISFEVFSDNFSEMEEQAKKIGSWGDNVYVKIPVTNTKGESSANLVKKLALIGMKINVTAVFTLDQVRDMTDALKNSKGAYISVFAGRIADTGRDPLPHMREFLKVIHPYPQIELIWASPRELLNIFQADAIGCQIITVTNDILKNCQIQVKALRNFHRKL